MDRGLTSRRFGLALLLLVVTLSSSACYIDALQVQVFDKPLMDQMERILKEDVDAGSARLVGIADNLLRAMCVLLCFVTWYRIHHGTPWIAVAKEWLFGVVLAMWLMNGVKAGHVGLDIGTWIPKASLEVSKVVYNETLIGTGSRWLDKWNAQMREAVKQTGGTVSPTGSGTLATLEAAWGGWKDKISGALGIANFWVTPVMLAFVFLNLVVINLISGMMYMSWAILLCLYRVFLPLVIPCIVLEQTRPIFVGWLRAYISVACWPIFMAAIKRTMTVIDWASLFNKIVVNSVPGAPFVAWTVILFVNLIFLLMFLSVPVISNRVTTGISQHVKAGFF